MKHLFCFAILSLSAATCFADRQGNGGDSVVCYSDQHQITSVEMFDHFEARTRYQTPINMAFAGATFKDKIDFVLKNIGKIEPYREKRLRDELARFWSSSNFAAGVKLPLIPDTGEILLPDNCQFEQLAKQQEPQFPTDKFYTIAKDLWDHMTEDGRAGLVLHEIIYRLAIVEERHQNSASSRFFNIAISSESFSNVGISEYLELLKNSNFKLAGTYSYRGIQLTQCSYLDNVGPYCRHSSGGSWTFPNGMTVVLSPNEGIGFNSDSTIHQASIQKPVAINLFGNSVHVAGLTFFNENGDITDSNISEPVNFKFASGLILPIVGEYRRTKHEMSSVILASNAPISQHGTCQIVGSKGSQVNFDEYDSINGIRFGEGGGQICVSTGPDQFHAVGVPFAIDLEEWQNDLPTKLLSQTVGSTLTVPVQSTTATFQADDFIHMHSNGIVARGHLMADVDLYNVEGALMHYLTGTNLIFTAQGKVLYNF